MADNLFLPLGTSRPPRESEREVLERWRRDRVFLESLERTKGGKPFVFYEGPPTANGTPHHGHVLTRVVKDLFPRYKTMDGFHVERKAGWDTHGLPVETEVEKTIGSKRKQDIEAYGVSRFIDLCKESVWKYKKEWEQLTERIGFWLDLENPYVTYSREYVDSVWWALKTIWEKGHLKRGYKSLAWCPVCQTGLSNAEVGLGYQEVADPAVTVAFKLRDTENTFVLAWTTTPWTLPSNVALAVGPAIEYGLHEAPDGRRYWLATARAAAYKKELPGEPLEKKLVKDLVGLRYEPLYDFHGKLEKRAHVVVAGDFVATEDGTGVVHVAPGFGEDDYKAALANDLAFVQLVSPDGTFKEGCGSFSGKWIKDADPEVLRDLKERKLVFRHEQYVHDYPHCWRTGTPLIYYAREAWFVTTTAVKDQLVSLNRTIAWAPEHIGTGRFGQFLEENRDWNVSRERYWATPLPVWTCEKCGKHRVVGSRKELVLLGATLSGKKLASADEIEPHRPHVDQIVLACACSGRMVRDPAVIDCWFDSGSMPFAQWGYPHVPGSVEKFERNFPASFICEAIDQTRGWFYTLHAISTLLFGRVAYERCLVLGHVLNPLTKKKYSKRDKNYTPTDKLLDEHGADAIRWFFYSKMTPGQPVLWKDEGVKDARRTFLLKILNVYQFFQEYASIDRFDPRPGGTPAVPLPERPALDRWALSSAETTTRKVREALDSFDFHAAALALEDFVDAVSNWYVRRSRERAWSAASPGNREKWAFWLTLHSVLERLSLLLAPFVPFLADDLHRALLHGLGPGGPGGTESPDGRVQKSVHLERYPKPDEARVDRGLEERMDLARRVAALGKRARTDAKLKVRQPLRLAAVLLSSSEDEAKLRDMLAVVEEELNVKAVEISSSFDKYVTFDVFPDWKSVGKRLGKRFRGKEGQEVLNAALRALGPRVVAAQVRDGKAISVDPKDGQGALLLEPAEVLVRLSAQEGRTAAEEHGVVVVLDTFLDEGLRLEALAAEVRTVVQQLRKFRQLPYDARIRLSCFTESETLGRAVKERGEWLKEQTLAVELELARSPDAALAAGVSSANGDPRTEGDVTYQNIDLAEEGKLLVVLREASAE
ncbi:isoleucine--tRNA ligase [bacterium]|nr:isoleucine--tRNA ligase [bacterium]